MILACVNHVIYDSIHKVVGCSPQLVYSVLSCHENEYTPRYKKIQDNEIVLKKKRKVASRVFKKGDEVLIEGDARLWEVIYAGREVLTLKSGYDSKAVQKYQVA
jgi:hypothetical protein